MANKKNTTKLSGKIRGYAILVALVVAAWAVFKILTPDNFGSADQMVTYFQASLLASVGAIGFYFVMVMGMFDFSIGAVIILSSIVGGVLGIDFGLCYIGFVLGPLLCGGLCGLINGGLYIKLRIPSMIVTTGMALIFESVANYVAGGEAIQVPADLKFFGTPQGVIIASIIAFVIAYFLLNYTRFGTFTYAIGSNEFTAKNMGIKIEKWKIIAFVLSGVYFGLNGILAISFGGSMIAVTGMQSMTRNFIPTMGCFFGVAFKKYGIPLQAIVLGEFFINIIYYGSIALGAPTALQEVVQGILLLLIIAVTTKVRKGEVVK